MSYGCIHVLDLRLAVNDRFFCVVSVCERGILIFGNAICNIYLGRERERERERDERGEKE